MTGYNKMFGVLLLFSIVRFIFKNKMFLSDVEKYDYAHVIGEHHV